MTRRQCALNLADRWLDGEFYAHLPHDFTVELENGSGEYIPLLRRRPSWQANIPQLLSRELSFKLWAGQNRPRFDHDSEALCDAAETLVREGHLIEKMVEATFCGQAGSVFVSFSLVDQSIEFDVWHARDCTPMFDDAGELQACRIQYLCSGQNFLAQGVTQAIGEEGVEPIVSDGQYWFTREYGPMLTVTYRPIVGEDFKPNDPETAHLLRPDEERLQVHALGQIPGVWIRNLPGGDHPDGACTFEPGLENCVVLDYTMSQLDRGLLYNLCPQVVLQGELLNETFEDGAGQHRIHRGPTNVFQFPAVQKGLEGQQTGGGDAKLLESNGAVFEKAREIVELMKKLILEQILASRKDPDKFSGPQSGAAAKILDEEHDALVQVMRSSYGERGFLPLVKLALVAAFLVGHPGVPNVDPSELKLVWPVLHKLTPQDFSLLQPALFQAVQLGWIGPEDAQKIWAANLDIPLKSLPPPQAPPALPDPVELAKAKSAGKPGDQTE